MALCAPALTAPAQASGLAVSPSATDTVAPKAASGTPYLAKTSEEQKVRQIVQCGSKMYVVGKLWKIEQNGTVFNHRNDVFSFSAKPPYTLTTWIPNVTGQVNSIAFDHQKGCGTAYLGGDFTRVHGTAATNIAAVSTSTGAVVSSFRHDANAQVQTLVGYKGHLLVGGQFTKINGSAVARYVSLNPSTGENDGFINFKVSGALPGNDPAEVYNQQLSHSGNLLLAEGNFTSVGGLARQQIFMVNLAGSTAQVTGWTAPDFNQNCLEKQNFYARSAAWSPDDSTIYTADTGDHILNWTKTFPLTGLCDAVTSFPATQTSVSPNWIEYSGCDSYYSVAADNGAVYAAGHPRWADNPNDCNNAGPGAVKDHGLQGLSPATGEALTYANGTPRYTMSRANADSMLITGAGLWIGSTNRGNSNACEGVSDHSGICFLPYAG